MEIPSNPTNLNAQEVIRLLPDNIKENAEIVGAWVWVTFSETPSLGDRTLLKQLGFHYNDKRKCWQHCGGVKRRFNARINPKSYYSVSSVRDMEMAGVR